MNNLQMGNCNTCYYGTVMRDSGKYTCQLDPGKLFNASNSCSNWKKQGRVFNDQNTQITKEGITKKLENIEASVADQVGTLVSMVDKYTQQSLDLRDQNIKLSTKIQEVNKLNEGLVTEKNDLTTKFNNLQVEYDKVKPTLQYYPKNIVNYFDTNDDAIIFKGFLENHGYKTVLIVQSAITAKFGVNYIESETPKGKGPIPNEFGSEEDKQRWIKLVTDMAQGK